ncbi:hypothetical protein [Comamonas sp. NLF-1-9]|uniref:hypothetical protein n=1 Tax=Comamonas sp. NLF-1-9 TaxID=2853163 RepID=UPI001C4714DA|nr:hypothetical protein [Comamonas sp. NLF-1-9]QXL83976.1 hypothetical protein KUD94_12155 [Comamonas sp. NLF-1-9]
MNAETGFTARAPTFAVSSHAHWMARLNRRNRMVSFGLLALAFGLHQPKVQAGADMRGEALALLLALPQGVCFHTFDPGKNGGAAPAPARERGRAAGRFPLHPVGCGSGLCAVADIHPRGGDVPSPLQAADRALYAIKEAGRNQLQAAWRVPRNGDSIRSSLLNK